MRLHLFPMSGRAIATVALTHYLALDCELQPVDLSRGDQRTSAYGALNPNRKIPTLEHEGLILWESNAILFYLASQRPQSGLVPPDPKGQADVLRWLFWESAHWDAESIGMVAYEKGSKAVLGLGPPDPAFIARGEQNFNRFAAVLEESLAAREWLVGERLTIADFSVGGLVPSAERMGLPVSRFPQIRRWYRQLADLPAWGEALAYRDAAMAQWQARRAAG